MAGIGDVMLAHLRAHGPADTAALAKAAGTDPGNAYSRLSFVSRLDPPWVERVSGKGLASVWKASAEAPAPAPDEPTSEEAQPAVASGLGAAFGRTQRGWKPSRAGLPPLTQDVAIVRGKTTLLVEYPERWRSSAVAVVVRAPDAGGVAQCWDLYGKCFCYVDVVGHAERGWKVSVLPTLRDVSRTLGGEIDEASYHALGG